MSGGEIVGVVSGEEKSGVEEKRERGMRRRKGKRGSEGVERRIKWRRK